MTTRLTRPIARIVQTRLSGDLVLRMTPEGLYVKEFGRRTWYGPIAYGALLLQGARAFAREKKKEQAERRKARKAARGSR